MFSGAISMAAGSYLSSLAQKEIFDKGVARSGRSWLKESPIWRLKELLRALGEEGLSKEQSYRRVGQSPQPRTKRVYPHAARKKSLA